MNASLKDQVRAKFAAMDLPDFSEWLSTGLRLLYSAPEVGLKPFEFAYPFLNRRESDSPVDDLAYIYVELVPETKKHHFRASVRDVLVTHASRRHFPAEAVPLLISLIAEIEADECLICLPQVVTDAAVGRQSDMVLAKSLGTCKQLLPSPAALDAIRALISSSKFDFRFTFDILTQLCLACSEEWVDHFKRLSGHLSELYDFAKDNELEAEFIRDRRIFVQRFAEYVPIQTFTKRLNANEMEWFSDALYEGATDLVKRFIRDKDSPFKWKKKKFVDQNILQYRVDVSSKKDSSIRATLAFQGQSSFPRYFFGEFFDVVDLPFESTPIAQAAWMIQAAEEQRLKSFFADIGSSGPRSGQGN